MTNNNELVSCLQAVFYPDHIVERTADFYRPSYSGIAVGDKGIFAGFRFNYRIALYHNYIVKMVFVDSDIREHFRFQQAILVIEDKFDGECPALFVNTGADEMHPGLELNIG
jgi:hypothetical protein